MQYQIKVIKLSPNKSVNDMIMDYSRFDKELFNGDMTADETIEILNHLYELRSRAERELKTN